MDTAFVARGRSFAARISRRRERVVNLAVALCLLLLCISTADAQPPRKSIIPKEPAPKRKRVVPSHGWEQVTRRGLNSAVDNARRDALERLEQRIGELRVSPSRRVSDYFPESKRFSEGLCTEFEGVRFSDPRYTTDQICVVRIEVSLDAVIARLQRLCRDEPGRRFHDAGWENIRRFEPPETLIVWGQGVPGLAEVGRRGADVWYPRPEWVEKKLIVTASARPSSLRVGTAAGKLIATREALKKAREQLAVELRRLPLQAQGLSVSDAVDQRLSVANAFDEWVSRQAAGRTLYRPDGEVEVSISADLSDFWRCVAPPQRTRRLHERRRGFEHRPTTPRGR